MTGNVVKIGNANQPAVHEGLGSEALYAQKIRAAWFKSDSCAEHETLIGGGRAILAAGADGTALATLDQARRIAETGEIRKALMMLVAAFPNAARTDLTAFGAALSLDVAALRPSAYAIHAACRALRLRARWLPTIAEVAEAIAGAEAELAVARRALEELGPMIDELEARIEQAREQSAVNWTAASIGLGGEGKP